MMQLPTFSQWKQIFKVLKKKEQLTLATFFLVAVVSLAVFVGSVYVSNTKEVPAFGGSYIEGVVGQPRFINPIYGETNDIDRSLIDLVFSGLMTYDNQGHIVPDLAQAYKVSSDGKVYDFELKDNLFWHDGKPLTTDDIVFTIATIQNSEYKSPLRANWIDVDVQKISDKSLRFTLKAPYNSFLENLTVKIIPKHIWESISAENFALSPYNLQPVGSGLFSFKSISQTSAGFIKSIVLESNRRYYNQSSYLPTLTFDFFEKKEDLILAANSRQINGFSLAPLDNNQTQAQKDIKQSWPGIEKFAPYSFSMPRYVAVFFNNQKSSLFNDPNLRKAMTQSVNKDDLVKTLAEQTGNTLQKVDSPILPQFFGYEGAPNLYAFNLDQANSLLDKAGFKQTPGGGREKSIAKKPAFQFTAYLKIGSKGTQVTELQSCLRRLPDLNVTAMLAGETNGTFGTGTDAAVNEFQKKYLPDVKPTGETGAATRKKLNDLCQAPTQNSQPLSFTLATVNQPQLVQAANMLKNYWQAVGATVTINAVSASDIKAIIKNRDYDALLYGEALGAEPDLYPFWHSSQKLDPGLNLSSYENKQADQLLKDAREALDESVKQDKLEKLQGVIISDAPALFLYNPDYSYWVTENIHGIDTAKIIDPAKRFSNISQWYVKTKRVFK